MRRQRGPWAADLRLFLGLAILFVAACIGAPASRAEGPPLVDGWYESEGACPFERCMYQDWSVTEDTILFDRIRGNRRVGAAVAGQTVDALTGVVFARPVPVEVVHATTLHAFDVAAGAMAAFDLDIGATLYLLDYEGEAFQVSWLEGRLLSVDVGVFWTPYRSEDEFTSCDVPSESCWWRIAPLHRRQATDWWVKIRLPDGTIGWTNEVSSFGNMTGPG